MSGLYLGRQVDPEDPGGAGGERLELDSADLLTHGLIVGMTGSGSPTAMRELSRLEDMVQRQHLILVARDQGKRVSVIADETRPVLQGARLTAWELMQENIPVTLITDNAAGSILRSGAVNLVILGTDRTARNGDVANKIGT